MSFLNTGVFCFCKDPSNKSSCKNPGNKINYTDLGNVLAVNHKINALEHRAFLAHIKFKCSTEGASHAISWPKDDKYPTVLYNRCSYGVIVDSIANSGVGHFSQYSGTIKNNLTVCGDIFGNGGDAKLFPGLPKEKVTACGGKVLCKVNTHFKRPGKKFGSHILATTPVASAEHQEALADFNFKDYAVLEVVPYQVHLTDVYMDVYMQSTLAIPTKLTGTEVSRLDGSTLRHYSKAFDSIYVTLLATPKEGTPFTVTVSLKLHKQDELELPVANIPPNFIEMESKDCNSFDNFAAARDSLLGNLKCVTDYILNGTPFSMVCNKMLIEPTKTPVKQAADVPKDNA